MTTDLRAEDIAEDLIYRTGKGLSGEDVESIWACFEYPQLIETLDGEQLAETEADMRALYARVRDYFAANGVRDVVRSVVSAKWLAPDMIGATHVSQLLLSDGTPFRAPYPSYSVLHCSGGAWRISLTIAAILDAPEHNAAILNTVHAFRNVEAFFGITLNAGSVERRRL